MKIIRLYVEGVQKITVAEVTPKGNVVRVSGANDAGKTSLLNSIYYLLAGASALPPDPIRHGETKAKIEAEISGDSELDLGDIIVRKVITEKNVTLVIENKKGHRFAAPQKMLDSLIGRLSFDPMAFMQMKAEDQLKTLRELTGLDTSDLDKRRKELYEERTAAKRELGALQARYEAMPVTVGAPDAEVSQAEIIEKLNKAMEGVNAHNAVKRQLDEIGTRIENGKKHIDDLRAQITKAEDLLQQLEGQQNVLDHQLAETMPLPDIQAIKTELSQVEDKNKAARAKRERSNLKVQVDAAEKNVNTLNESINAIDGEKEARIAAAKFPLDGMSFGENGVIYNGVLLEQASTAQQIRVSMAMAMALNPKLRLIIIKNGSLLDSKSQAIIEEMAADKDYQVWQEVVDETGKVGIVMSEGQVIAVN